MSKDDRLYGQKRARDLTSGSELSSSHTLSFTSQLSSLINSSANDAASRRPRQRAGAAKDKDDIFKTHNRHASKRAKRDLDPDYDGVFQAVEQKHTTRGETVDSDILANSRRKMQHKARIYAALKRGDLEDVDAKYAVDFDAKWAAGQDGKADSGRKDLGEESSDDSDGSMGRSGKKRAEDQIEYVDELGRTRMGTRLEAAIAAQASRARDEVLTARPAAPTNLIYGDTIQHGAFAPAEERASRMADLAAKRDRSLTPPSEVHFDGDWEMRSRGTGFFTFAKDEDERRAQMQGLEEQRAETERVRAARDVRIEERKAAIEKRREEVLRRRADKMAADFLSDLGKESSGANAAISKEDHASGKEDAAGKD